MNNRRTLIYMGLSLTVLVGLLVFSGTGRQYINQWSATPEQEGPTTIEPSTTEPQVVANKAAAREECLITAKQKYIAALAQAKIECKVDSLGWPDMKCIQQTDAGTTLLRNLAEEDEACYRRYSDPLEPGAVISTDTLITDSHTPTVSGYACGLTSVYVDIWENTPARPTSETEVVGGSVSVPANCYWSFTVSDKVAMYRSSLPSGTYTVNVYDERGGTILTTG